MKTILTYIGTSPPFNKSNSNYPDIYCPQKNQVNFQEIKHIPKENQGQIITSPLKETRINSMERNQLHSFNLQNPGKMINNENNYNIQNNIFQIENKNIYNEENNLTNKQYINHINEIHNFSNNDLKNISKENLNSNSGELLLPKFDQNSNCQN